MLATREEIDGLNEAQLRTFAARLVGELRFKQTLIDKFSIWYYFKNMLIK